MPEPEAVSINGKKYDYYAVTQKKRSMERKIRALKREREALKALNMDTTHISKKIKQNIREYEEFCDTAKVKPDINRLRYESGTSDLKKTEAWSTYKQVVNSKKNDIIKLSINLFDKSDQLYFDMFSIEEIPGFEDIGLHGSSSSVQMMMDGKRKNLSAIEFAEYLKRNTDYSGGNIRLASCSTGKGDNSFAQQLSKELHVKVMAPDDDVYFAPDEGVLFVGDPRMNTGRWRTFNDGVEE